MKYSLPSLTVHQLLFITVTNQATGDFKHYFCINFSLIIKKPVFTPLRPGKVVDVKCKICMLEINYGLL